MTHTSIPHLPDGQPGEREKFPERNPRGRIALPDGEAADADVWVGGFDEHVFDVVGEGGFLAELVEEGVDFIALSLELEFDGAVGEVFDPSGDVESAGELFGGVAEPDALDAALKDNPA